MPAPATEPTPKRATYRHGNLRSALLDAALELAREGGPDAVSLREVTRRAGVSPNAAYRHFADRGALVHAVSQAAMAHVARAMEAEIDALPSAGDPAAGARARFRAVGTGYLRFAVTEPGWFRTAFHVPADMVHATDTTAAGEGGLTPSSCSAPPWTGSWTSARCPPSVARARSSSPGRRCTGWRCW